MKIGIGFGIAFVFRFPGVKIPRKGREGKEYAKRAKKEQDCKDFNDNQDNFYRS